MTARDYRLEALALAKELAAYGPPFENQLKTAMATSSTGTELAMRVRWWLWSVVELPTLDPGRRETALDLIEHIDQLLT